MNGSYRKWILALFFSVVIFSGCAGPNLYSINMYYDAQKAAIPAYLASAAKSSNHVIAIAEFVDARPVDEPLAVGRVIEDDGAKILVFPKNVKAAKSVTGGIKNYLKKAGFSVADKVEQWNLKEDGIPMGDAKILIGGSIEELEIFCRRGLPTNTYRSRIRLNVVLADMSGGKILYKTTVESNLSREYILFSENVLGDEAGALLADAIERLFEDKGLIQKLQEPLLPPVRN